MFSDYSLRFDDEQQANDVLEPILSQLKPWEFVRYDIGQIKRYEYDEQDIDAEPIVIIVSDKWHVDLRLLSDNDALDKYRVYPDSPVHAFS